VPTKLKPPPPSDVVLLGIGHTNAHILRMWRMRPPPGARLTCISDHRIATYSGMLPGVLAAQYPPERMEIDLERLTAAAGARLVIGDVTGLHLEDRTLRFEDRPPLRFDLLSIGIGSTPGFDGVRVVDGARLLPIKPMQSFLPRLDHRIRQALSSRAAPPVRIAIVGGGAGGAEVALCLPPHLRRQLGTVPFELTTVTANGRLPAGSLPRTARRVERILTGRGVRLLKGSRVVEVDGRVVLLDDGTSVEADVIVWATAAAPPPLLARMGLPTDERGFLLTHETLQSTSGAPVFVVGDTGTIAGAPTPKAGVYAVRQGPVLWDNIQRALRGAPLRRYDPQRRFLRLLNTGDGRAIAEWRGLSFEGAWCWWLKDAIDTRFMKKYQDYG
jgi:selenide, water dikinase